MPADWSDGNAAPQVPGFAGGAASIGGEKGAVVFGKADESAATANILVVNAILTRQMREANPDKAYRTFTSAEDIAEAIAFICSHAAAKMNGKRLPLYP